MSKQIKMNAITYAVLISELQEGGRSVRELVHATGCHPCTIRGYMRALHHKGCVFIVNYELDRARAKCYTLGRRADARRPPARTPKQCYRDRQAAAQRAAMRELTVLTNPSQAWGAQA